MDLYFPSPLLAQHIYQDPCILIMFLALQNLLRILFMYASSLLITTALWNLTHLVVL